MSSTSVEMRETASKASHKICGICNENPSKYCCPRCEIFYCSLGCYKAEKHQNCSEDFYRECVNTELAAHHVDDESRKKMLDILKRMQNGDIEDPDEIEDLINDMPDEDYDSIDSDDNEHVDLKDRLEGLSLDNPDAIWQALTEDEKNEFEAMIAKGDVGSIIPQWEPWWSYSKEEKLIEDCNGKLDSKEADNLSKCPKIIDVPNFSSLTNVKPSPTICYNIMNVVASYAFVIRYFNGELEPLESAVTILEICSNLSSNTNYEDPSVAVESVAQNCMKSQLIETDEVSLEVMRHDTYLILKGHSKEKKDFYCQACLSHVHKLFVDAKKGNKNGKTEVQQKENVFKKKFPDHQKQHLPQLDISKVKKSIKKIEYYISYINSFGMVFQ